MVKYSSTIDNIDATQGEIAHLIVLVVHVDQLEPMRSDESLQKRWVGTIEFTHDFKQVQWIAQALCEQMYKIDTGFKESLKWCEDHLGKCIQTCHVLLDERGEEYPSFVLKSLYDLL